MNDVQMNLQSSDRTIKKIQTESGAIPVMKKTHILTPFDVKIASNYAFLFLNNENKILLGPPNKRLRDTNIRDTATRTIAMNTRNVLVSCWV